MVSWLWSQYPKQIRHRVMLRSVALQGLHMTFAAPHQLHQAHHSLAMYAHTRMLHRLAGP
jgi:hypothetical protein